MRILSITAQKPDSTGSGVYLNELVKEFHAQGHEQAVVAGIYKTDEIHVPDGVEMYPLYFKTEEVPFAICGMSDEMPYESTVYGQMTDEMVDIFEVAFKKKIHEAVEQFNPDIIICHHLYLVTSFTRELYPDKKIYAFCHNTDIRQMKKITLKREYIKEQIQKLDGIFSLHEEQKNIIMSVYEIPSEKIQVVGVGYNQHIFYGKEEKMLKEDDDFKKENILRLIYAGKLAEKKGVMSLLKSLNYLSKKLDRIELELAGGYGNEEEYTIIKQLAKEAPYPVRFLGKLPQNELADAYRRSDIFVLSSFYEGLPMTAIEAMACGDKVVVTDLPGVKPWINGNVEQAPVVYIPMPEMKNTDEPVEESLPAFEQAIADAIFMCHQLPLEKAPNLNNVSWGAICHMVVNTAK